MSSLSVPAKANEKNREIEVDSVNYGPLSYAVASAYNTVGIHDIKTFLDKVYIQMNKDVPFQSPQTINSIGYKFPTIKDPEPAGGGKKGGGDDEEPSGMPYYLAAGTVLLISILILWKRRKK